MAFTSVCSVGALGYVKNNCLVASNPASEKKSWDGWVRGYRASIYCEFTGKFSHRSTYEELVSFLQMHVSFTDNTGLSSNKRKLAKKADALRKE